MRVQKTFGFEILAAPADFFDSGKQINQAIKKFNLNFSATHLSFTALRNTVVSNLKKRKPFVLHVPEPSYLSANYAGQQGSVLDSIKPAAQLFPPVAARILYSQKLVASNPSAYATLAAKLVMNSEDVNWLFQVGCELKLVINRLNLLVGL